MKRIDCRLRGVAAVAMLAACGDGAKHDAPTVSVRDSAGVEIVDNGAVHDAPLGWTVADTPSLSLGGEAADTGALGFVRGAARLSDGRVVVSNWMGSTFELRYFAPDGKTSRGAGRTG